ncbi:unnamed protein product [Polarella glacialis]|uniref:Uncharacterized protein n=1 Tax=Polarella glacialis TaxID=89957 RepID=A0A813DC32_POLGL|nr:unnamed protein product [Polarella glacialis]
MLATIGYIVPEYFKFPGMLSPSQNLAFADMPTGLAAASKIPGAGWVQILAFVGIVEISNLQSTPTAFAGDFEGYGAFGIPFGKGIADPEKKKKSLTAELNNGRLAMMAIIGMFYQDGLTGSAWGDWALYTDSPLRALTSNGNTAVDFSAEIGITPPFGFWDPLELSQYENVELAKSQFKRRRVIEIQHGRVAMLATIGYIVPEYFKFPGMLSPSQNLAFADMPTGLAAASKIPGAGWVQILAFVGIVEISNLQSTPTAFAGDFEGYGAFGIPFGKGIADPEKKKKSLTAELNNGRLAMMAIIGMFYQDGLTGSAWGDWALYTDSPLRALTSNGNTAVDFSAEIGITPPFGFWDPLELSQYENVELAKSQFKRRRVIEIQHGRVAMLATIGYIVPEYFKFPGMLSPSQNLAFADMPTGLAAASKIPGAGWVQILAFVGIVEISNLQSTPTAFAGDFEGYGALGIPFGKGIADPEKKKKSLTAELNNGRLAMMAIIGMFYQDGLTGSAWGDWALYTDSPLRALTSNGNTAVDF